MLDSRDRVAATTKSGTTLGLPHFVGKGVLGDDIGTIGTSKGNAEVLGGRFDGNRHRATRM